MRTHIASLVLVSMVASCDLDVGDLNNPGIGDLEQNPTEVSVNAATTGLIIGNRRNHAQANGFVAQLAILGREAYNFDQADPRYIGELLQGELNRGSPFGGNFWAGPYANLRLGTIVRRAVDKVEGFSAEEKAAIRGFSKTINALDLLEVIVTRDTNGAVIDTDNELDDPLPPIVDKAAVYAEIARLLDEGAMDLDAGGEAFTFELSSGYAGFDTPATFKTFNRAIRARVAAYMEDYPTVLTALAASFIDTDVTTQGELDVGVYHAYSTGAGDAVNNLINPNIFAHKSLATDAMKNGMQVDQRFARKVTTTSMPGSAQGLTSNLKFTIYTAPDSPVPVIRNEELLLLRAEALYFTGDVPGAMMALNTVRTVSGGLPPIGGAPAEAAFIDALLYERRYSLMMEWGHRWIDARRFDRIDQLPLDAPEHKRNVRYPIPLAECNARPNEPACQLGST